MWGWDRETGGVEMGRERSLLEGRGGRGEWGKDTGFSLSIHHGS